MKFDRLAENIVRTLLKSPGKEIDIWQLARRCGYFPDVVRGVEQLADIGAVEARDSQVKLADTTKLPPYILKKETPLSEVMPAYIGYWKQLAALHKNEFCQFPMLPSGVQNKLALMSERGDLLNRDILCIGDDDYFSIACALTGLPRSVTVFDIDPGIVSGLKSVSPELPVPIQAVELDLLNPLPKRYHDAFDVFVTEPPDTLKGTLQFVAQGLRAARAGGVVYLGVTAATVNAGERQAIEQAMTKSGVMFTDILHDHEEYASSGDELTWLGFEKLPAWITKPSQHPWYTSALFRGEIVNKKSLRLPGRVTQEELVTSFMEQAPDDGNGAA